MPGKKEEVKDEVPIADLKEGEMVGKVSKEENKKWPAKWPVNLLLALLCMCK